MSDEPFKKPGAKKLGLRPDKPALDQLQAELSANLKTGEDAFFYDWTATAAAPPSEAAYVPPMQIQTLGMNTRELAVVIGQEAAEAARYAPPPAQTVVIDGDARSEHAREGETFGDAIPTEEMPGAPVSDDRYGVTRRLSSGGARGRSGWLAIALAMAAVLGCVAFVWTQRGSDAAATPARSSNDLGAPAATTPSPTKPSAVPTTSSSSLPLPKTPTSLTAAEPATAAVTLAPPTGTSPSQSKGSPAVVPQPEHLPSRRSPAGGSTPRSRAPSTPQTPPMKPTGSEAEDPLLVEHPGY